MSFRKTVCVNATIAVLKLVYDPFELDRYGFHSISVNIQLAVHRIFAIELTFQTTIRYRTNCFQYHILVYDGISDKGRLLAEEHDMPKEGNIYSFTNHIYISHDYLQILF